MRKECEMLNAECGMNAAKHCCAPAFSSIRHSSFVIRHSALGPARGITLIELLITMTIIAIISALIMGTAASAIENAREKRTQSLVTKIHTLIMERYASYETRRVDLHSSITSAINGRFPDASSAKQRGEAMADARLLAMRELMRLEMPDRWSDVLSRTESPAFLSNLPPLARQYQKVKYGLNAQNSDSPSIQFQSAECLYLVVMAATGDGEARTLFNKQEIGDVDGDGAMEFVDGWGRPISWLRWPAGVVSDLQPMVGGVRPFDSDHDPIDMFRRDHPDATRVSGIYTRPALTAMTTRLATGLGAYRLTPLIYSGGPDGETATHSISNATDDNAVVDPYSVHGDYLLGTKTGPEANDNITNHLIEY